MSCLLATGCGGDNSPAPSAAAGKPDKVAAAKPSKQSEKPAPPKAKSPDHPAAAEESRPPAGKDAAVAKDKPHESAKMQDHEPDPAPEQPSDAEGEAGAPAHDRRNNDTERLLLFTPAGPLVVELKLIIDGRPYGFEREQLVDDLLELADRNRDGRPKWEEVFEDPKRVFSRRLSIDREQMDRRQFMKTHDTNQNGIVDRDEARRFVARSNNAGQAFTIDSSSRYRDTNARQSLTRGLLDVDGDEIVSGEEMAAAATRLRLRDANDDAIVSLAELDDSLAGDSQAMLISSYRNSPAAVRLGPLAEWDGVIYTFSELYLRRWRLPDDGFPLTPSLAAQLDIDGDGTLSRDELMRLDAIEPHVVLAVRFGADGEQPPGIECESAAAELGEIGDLAESMPGGMMFKLGGLRLRFQFLDRMPANGPTQSPEDQLAALDADKNGYLEKKEVEEKSPNIAGMFDDWDANGDGMVYPKEIAAYERGRRAPLATAIRITAHDDQDALFPWLDSDLDNRLTPRELRAAAARLAELDADGDGQLSIDEIPGGVTVEIERGAAMNAPPRRDAAMTAAAQAAADGPKWFAAMDSNRDAEVSRREFPGSRQKFSQLDADGDGFISIAEAAESEPEQKSEEAGENSDKTPGEESADGGKESESSREESRDRSEDTGDGRGEPDDGSEKETASPP